MVEWALSLSPVFTEAVRFVCEAPAPLPKQNTFFHRLRSKELIQQYPDASTRLVTHVLNSTKVLPYQCGYVEQVVRILNESGVAKSELRDAVEAMIRAGCTNGTGLWEALT